MKQMICIGPMTETRKHSLTTDGATDKLKRKDGGTGITGTQEKTTGIVA